MALQGMGAGRDAAGAAGLYILFPFAEGEEIRSYRLVPAYEAPPRRFVQEMPEGFPDGEQLPATACFAALRNGEVAVSAGLSMTGEVALREVEERRSLLLPKDCSLKSDRSAIIEIFVWPQQQRLVLKLYFGYEEKWMSTSVFVMNHVEIKELETSGYSALATPSSDLPCCRREMTTFQESAFKFVGLIDDANALLFAPLKLELGVDVMLTAHKLGEGSFGTVQKCEIFGKPGAVKSLRHNTNGVYEPWETRILASLHHRNILQLYNAWVDNKKIYICSELCLGAIYFESRASGPDVEHIFQEIVLALQYLHSMGVVHRDLKPENILLHPDNYARIIDFGLAAIMPSEDAMLKGGKIGTPDYRAPEICHPHGMQVDVYTAGIIYYELHIPDETRQRKTRRGSLRAIRNKILYSTNWRCLSDKKLSWSKYTFARGWSGDVDLLLRMIAVESTERPSIEAILDILKERSEGAKRIRDVTTQTSKSGTCEEDWCDSAG